jgi:hypothetical protein
MNRCIAVAAVVVMSSVFGIGRVEALSPTVVKPVAGRCIFPSARILSAIISAEARTNYLSKGYYQAFVTTRLRVKKSAAKNLTKGNVAGLTSITPTAGEPAMLEIIANAGGTPLELGCSAEAELTTTVVLVDSAGVRSNGRSVAKVILQGVFQ